MLSPNVANTFGCRILHRSRESEKWPFSGKFLLKFHTKISIWELREERERTLKELLFAASVAPQTFFFGHLSSVHGLPVHSFELLLSLIFTSTTSSVPAPPYLLGPPHSVSHLNPVQDSSSRR